MVQPSFQHTAPAVQNAASATSATAPLDEFLNNQPATFYESIYKSEAACLCILR